MIHQGIDSARANGGNECHRNEDNTEIGCDVCDGFGPGRECCTGYMDYSLSRAAWSPCSVANFEWSYKWMNYFPKCLTEDTSGKFPACKASLACHSHNNTSLINLYIGLVSYLTI